MTVSSSSFAANGVRESDGLHVHLMGCVEFESAVFLQERLAYEIAGRTDRFGGLLVCEHPVMLSIGREGSRADVSLSDDELQRRGIPVKWVGRGGGTIVHAPGHLAVYPIVPLQRMGIAATGFRQRLLDSLLDVCRELKLPARIDDAHSRLSGRCGAFAHVGATVRDWTTRHGLFVDVSTSPQWLELIRPLNGSGRRSSMSTERVRPTAMNRVRESIIRNLSQQLGYDSFHLFTGHPLLKRVRRPNHDFASHPQ